MDLATVIEAHHFPIIRVINHSNKHINFKRRRVLGRLIPLAEFTDSVDVEPVTSQSATEVHTESILDKFSARSST